MKKIIIKNKAGEIGWGAQMEDPTAWIAECVASNAWGKPEHWLLHKDEPMAKAYDEADVLEEKIEQIDGVDVKHVKLKAEYTVEIIDLEQDPAWLLEKCIAKRKAEYPTAEEIFNALFDGGMDDLQAKRLAIKAKYPKP